MSHTLSCKLVKVFATICAVFLQNQAQDSVVLLQSPPRNLLAMVAPRYGGLKGR